MCTLLTGVLILSSKKKTVCLGSLRLSVSVTSVVLISTSTLMGKSMLPEASSYRLRISSDSSDNIAFAIRVSTFQTVWLCPLVPHRLWQRSSRWFSPTQFMRRPVACGCFLGSVQRLCCVLNCMDPHSVCQRKFHSVMLLTRMDQCPRRSLN